MVKEILRSLVIDRLCTVMDRAEARLAWCVDVGAVGVEEANHIEDVCHLGFVFVNFADAEGEVQHTVAFIVGCIDANAWCFEEFFEETYLTFFTC